MSEPTEQYAYFTITDSFDPEEITRRAGISPTDSWKKGDLHPKRRMSSSAEMADSAESASFFTGRSG